jgi:hypothetical protein
MPARVPTRLAAATALMTVVLASCGLTDPYQQHAVISRPTTATPAPPPSDQADPAPERGGTTPQSTHAEQTTLAPDAAQASPQAALARYARIFLNWNVRDVVQVQRRLASISLGQARAQALQAAASAARDGELAASRLANHGQVIALAPGQASAAGRWVIVTSERTTGQGDYQGLPPTQHLIYAQLTRTPAGYVVSQWAPQN